MTSENIKVWLKEGRQSKITSRIKKISSRFKGEDVEKIFKICKWIEKNTFEEKDRNKILKIFARRSADQIIKERNETGCHDTTVLLVTLLRASGIPAKYVLGIDRKNPRKGGHCVAEAYIEKNWACIDPTFSQISLIPNRSSFYRENYIIKKGKDSWDCGVKTVNDWEIISKSLVRKIKKI